MHHPTELPFVDEFQWVSPLHFVKNEWQNAVPLWCMLQVGRHLYTIAAPSCCVPPSYCHLSATFQNHEYHCCQRTGQSSGVSNFYHIFKFFMRLTFVLLAIHAVARVLLDAWSAEFWIRSSKWTRVWMLSWNYNSLHFPIRINHCSRQLPQLVSGSSLHLFSHHCVYQRIH